MTTTEIPPLGKTIRIYLVDGTPSGILTAEIINWTGKAIVAPRSLLAELSRRDEAKRTGVYCLVGPDPEVLGKERVYVGEGDSVLLRLTSHHGDTAKDFWTRAVMVISKDQNLTKAHVRYLESRLIQLVQQAGRASLCNNTAPAPPLLPEPDVADMEYFLGQIQMILPVLGFVFLQPKPTPSSALGTQDQQPSSPIFVMKVIGITARAREVGSEFVVLKGSTARIQGVPSWSSYKNLRDQLVEEGILVPTDDKQLYAFKEDTAFNSPSAAASVVRAGNANGRIEWKIEHSGQTYQQWYEDKLRVAGISGETDE